MKIWLIDNQINDEFFVTLLEQDHNKSVENTPIK